MKQNRWIHTYPQCITAHCSYTYVYPLTHIRRERERTGRRESVSAWIGIERKSERNFLVFFGKRPFLHTWNAYICECIFSMESVCRAGCWAIKKCAMCVYLCIFWPRDAVCFLSWFYPYLAAIEHIRFTTCHDTKLKNETQNSRPIQLNEEEEKTPTNFKWPKINIKKWMSVFVRMDWMIVCDQLLLLLWFFLSLTFDRCFLLGMVKWSVLGALARLPLIPSTFHICCVAIYVDTDVDGLILALNIQ